jgi:hypothetical protein
MVRFSGECVRPSDGRAVRYDVAVQGQGDLRIFVARVEDGDQRRRIEGRLTNLARLSGNALELHVQRHVIGSLDSPALN